MWLGFIYLYTTLFLVIRMTPCQSKCSFSAAFFSVLRQILEAWGLSSRFPELCCQEALWCAASCTACLHPGTEPRPSRADSHSRRWCIIPTNFWITAQQFTYLNSSIGLGFQTAVANHWQFQKIINLAANWPLNSRREKKIKVENQLSLLHRRKPSILCL